MKIGRKLAIGSSSNSAYLLATAAVSFLITPFLVRRLGDHQYGVWTLVVVFTGYYGVLELGLSSAVGRFMAGALGAGDRDRSNAVFNTALLIFGSAGGLVLVLSGVASVLTPLIVHNSGDATVFREAILILGLQAALDFPLRACRGVLQAHLRFGTVAGTDLITLFLRTLLVVGLVLRGYSVVGLATATLVALLPALFLYPYFISRDLPFLRLSVRQWRPALAKELFSYGLYSFLGYVGGVLRAKVTPFIVASFLGIRIVTHFRMAGMASGYYAELVAALIGVFQPLLSQQEGAGNLLGMHRTTLFATKIALCISGFFAFGAIAFGKVFLARWVGDAYLDAYPCMVLLVLSQALAVSQRPSTFAIFAMARHQFLGLLVVMEGVGNIVLSLLLVRHWGLTGVGWGALIPIAISKLVVQPIYACRVTGLDYPEYVRTVAAASLKVALSLVIPALIIFELARPDYKSMLLLAALSLILYGVPVATTVLSRSESQLLRRTILPRWAVGETD
ncbi:MAG TPA: oligosaccharide flippase family protein [Blastocatellia bacterium]|nr:oligosaccharide flippase family protein [Blastocatellia bacterium]